MPPQVTVNPKALAEKRMKSEDLGESRLNQASEVIRAVRIDSPGQDSIYGGDVSRGVRSMRNLAKWC